MSRHGEFPDLGDVPPDVFRDEAHELVDWIADYLERLDSLSVVPPVEPGDIRDALSSTPPDEAEPFGAILADLDRVVVPGLTHWGHPRFFAWFNSSGSAPGILGETLAATFNPNCMTWLASPAGTELEQVVVDWLRQMLGLPDGLWGIVNEGASLNSLLALATARESLGLDIRQQGLTGRPDLPRLAIYVSEQAHSSIDKAAITLGFGVDGVRKIPVDGEFRMIPGALEAALLEDRRRGWRPTCVVGTVGTTSTTSIDPIPEIARICRAEEVWLHVDAAHGGAAALCPEHRDVLAGCDRADSLIVNPHKWMFVPIEASVLYTRRPETLKRAFSLVPEYLRDDHGESVTNFMDYGITLGHRFRALKMWVVFRRFGREGLARRIREHVRLGRLVADWI
ncbi:MAG: pyridoxal-dependent decarboxylase, partial [Halobacteriales archaeon]|nr:pyridoxal-dependent decarboxylase [Halobacteriales archaeon]